MEHVAGPITPTSIRAGGISWETGTIGEWDAEPVVLLHGFPEHWRTWARVMPPLAAAGFRVHAPCLPGYGATTPPDSYAIDDLAAQVAALSDEVGHGRTHLIGHDWGGIVGAAAAALHPGSFRSVTLACCGHPAVFTAAGRDPRQVASSWYVGLFQIPGIEHLLGRREVLRRFSTGVTEIDTAEEMARALAYYRTNLRPWALESSKAGRITIPGLVMHAERDPAITEQLMRRTAEQIDDLRGFEIFDCGHFIHLRRPELFLEKLIPFLRSV